jgi:HAD superfamily hydrolase (TIGR01509 family)
MKRIEVPEHIRGLIFDCDGTLIDSMPLHMKGWEQVIKASGGAWDYEFFYSKRGTPEERIVQLYNEHSGMKLNPREIVRMKHEYFRSFSAVELKPIPQVIEVVDRYRGKLPMAVASGGVREIVNLELEALGIKDCFTAVLTADDHINPKPAPDIFLESARRIGVEPKYCQVFEDGDFGLEAAQSAGMLPTDIRLFI